MTHISPGPHLSLTDAPAEGSGRRHRTRDSGQVRCKARREAEREGTAEPAGRRTPSLAQGMRVFPLPPEFCLVTRGALGVGVALTLVTSAQDRNRLGAGGGGSLPPSPCPGPEEPFSNTGGRGESHLLPRPRQSPSWQGEARGPTSSCSLAGAGSTWPTAAGAESPDESPAVGQASFLPVCISDCLAQTRAGLAQVGRGHAGCGGEGLCCQGWTPAAWACWSQRCRSLTVPRQPLSSSRCNEASFQVLVLGAERSDDLLNCLTRRQESGPRPSREMPSCYPVPPLPGSQPPTLAETAQAKGQSAPEALCEPCGRGSYVEQACPLHRFWKGPAGCEEPRAWKLGAALVRGWRPCPQHTGANQLGG